MLLKKIWKTISSLCCIGALSFAFNAEAEVPPSSLQAAPVRAGTIEEVISRWRPDAHLYVLGDVGLTDETLAELAGWLADKHWTVDATAMNGVNVCAAGGDVALAITRFLAAWKNWHERPTNTSAA